MKVTISNIEKDNSVLDLIKGASTIIYNADLEPKNIFCNIDMARRVRDCMSAYRKSYNGKKMDYVFSTDFGDCSLYTTRRVDLDILIVTDNASSVI